MSRKHSARLALRYLSVAVTGSAAVVTLLIALLGQLWLLATFISLLISLLLGLAVHSLFRRDPHEDQPDMLRTLLRLAPDQEIAEVHAQIAGALSDVSERTDSIYRPLALERLRQHVRDCKLLAAGRIEFSSTESWRLVYEQMLRSPGLHLYRSVAHVETPHYWRDGPGRQSTQLNLQLQDAQMLSIERTVIVADHLWAEDSLFPIDPIHDWIDEQHRHGIWLLLVRESTLQSEPDLLCDVGIYGSRAVGMQTLDPSGRTKRFVLSFDFADVQRAEKCWERLAVYAVSYRDLLDRQH